MHHLAPPLADRHLTRTTVFFTEAVSVHELSGDGPAGCAPDERAPQWVARDTMLLTRAGCAALAYGARTRRPVIAEPIRVVLLRPADEFRVTYPIGGAFRGTVLTFSDATIERALDDTGHRAIVATAPVLLRYHRYRRALLRASRHGAIPELAAEEESLAILALACTGAASAGGVGGGRSYAAHQLLADRARVLLASAPGEAHRLGDVARRLGVSPFHLARVFRAQTGMPMHRYLVRLRLALALDHLGAGETELSGLALRLGFATHSHFSAAFRRMFGMSPRQARETLSTAELRTLRERLDRQS